MFSRDGPLTRFECGVRLTCHGPFCTLVDMPSAWNSWYHCTGNTYGTWLPGDPRGFRTRNHRMHVEGDYKAPPPRGVFDGLHALAKRSMKSSAVHLDAADRRTACFAMVAELIFRQVEVIALAVDDHHFHVLARCSDQDPRWWIGRAKRRASLVLQGRKNSERLWAARSRAEPIRDRSHQRNVFNYIVRHGERGAAVWTFRDAIPQYPQIR